MRHLLYEVLWGATWGNNAAAAEWLVLVAVSSAVLRKPARRIWAWICAEVRGPIHHHISAEIDALRRDMDVPRKDDQPSAVPEPDGAAADPPGPGVIPGPETDSGG